MLFAWLSWARVVKCAFHLWCTYRHSYSLSACMSLDPAAGTSFWFRFQILKGVLLSPKLCELSMGILCLECCLFTRKGLAFEVWSLGLECVGVQVAGCPCLDSAGMFSSCGICRGVVSMLLDSSSVFFGLCVLCRLRGWPFSVGMTLGCPSWEATSANSWSHWGRMGALSLQT